jgi:hypothetical protein
MYSLWAFSEPLIEAVHFVQAHHLRWMESLLDTPRVFNQLCGLGADFITPALHEAAMMVHL